jgi:hypothetical protein
MEGVAEGSCQHTGRTMARSSFVSPRFDDLDLYIEGTRRPANVVAERTETMISKPALTIVLLGVVTIAAGAAGQLPGAPPPLRPAVPACLHDTDERFSDSQRRESALELARALIRAQRESFQKSGRYAALASLKLPEAPAGFAVALFTNGEAFVLSIKDQRDSCRFGIFSDQDGLFYQGSPRVAQMAQTQ